VKFRRPTHPALGRTPQAIRVKAVERGIRLKRTKVKAREVRFVVPDECWAGVTAEAEQRGITIARLARLILETMARDDLFCAVLDLPAATEEWSRLAVYAMAASSAHSLHRIRCGVNTTG
jgi:hypothetical protein